MSKVEVKVTKLDNFKGELPAYESPGASGMDVRAQLSEPMSLAPGQRTIVPTGLAVEIPVGFEIQVRPRSGWAAKKGMTALNSPGTIDADYRGEIGVILINHGDESIPIKDQDRIAQLVLCPVIQLEWVDSKDLSETSRGSGGFGSTGIE